MPRCPLQLKCFNQACEKNVAWCLPNKLPPHRLAGGQLPPEVKTTMWFKNDRPKHMVQLVRDLGDKNQRLVLENRALQDQSKYHVTEVCSLQQREVSRVTTI